jgi:molybdopterin-guanine dinucleotide biosynthesis protein A
LIASLVLAGGRAMRLGGVDKPLLRLGDATIIDHVLLCLPSGPTAISANGDPARYAHLGLPVLADQVAGRGPLGGVLRGLGWAAGLGAEMLLTVPGDTPFLPPDLAARLSPGPSWAESPTGLHPLVALWPVACAPDLAAWLAAQPSGRVRAFGERIGMRGVWFGEGGDPFLNVNTPEELERARKDVLF